MTCSATAHVWTPLWTGWEPDVTSPCDCGTGPTWGEHQRALMQARIDRSEEHRDKWDVSRGPIRCRRCAVRGRDATTRRGVIGAGEPYRRVSVAGWPYCEDCALKYLDEVPPGKMPAITFADRLAPPAEDRPEPPEPPTQMTREYLQPPPADDEWWEA